MTDKNQKTFVVAGTLILALAGTGLTLFNNLDFDSKQLLFRSMPLAFALAAAFTAGELGFLWLHKVYESVTKRWRKALSITFMILLAGAMAFAFFQELYLVHQKQKGEITTKYVSKMFEGTKDARTHRIIARQNKLDIQMPDALPFVICYFLSAVSYVVASICFEKKRRRYGSGNVIGVPAINEAVKRRVGFADGSVTAYQDNKGNGVQYKVNGQYAGFIPKSEIEK